MATKSRRDRPRIHRSAPGAEHPRRNTPAFGDSSPTVAGVRISHPDRVIYPDLGTSKIQLARYFERIADWIVPHVAGRPLTLVHCPAGLAAPCNFLKHARAWPQRAAQGANPGENQGWRVPDRRLDRSGRIPRADGYRRDPHLEFDR